MKLWEALLLGLIQGLTEFLPVSSSGHLAICKNIFHIRTEGGILFDILLHLATLVVICVVYRKDVAELIVNAWAMFLAVCKNIGRFFANLFGKEKKAYEKILTTAYRKFVLMIIISTIPTGILGVIFEKLTEEAAEQLLIPGIFLLVTAVILILSTRIKPGEKDMEEAGLKDAIFVGIVQGFATLPGLSRSGSTITAGCFRGFTREFAVKYSFIMSIPAILGAVVLKLKDFAEIEVSGHLLLCYVAGMLVAAGVGFLCIKAIQLLVKKNGFLWFGIYCAIAGAVSIIYYFAL